MKETLTGSDTALTSADFNAGLPVVAFTLSQSFRKNYPHVEQQSISTLLRVKQYIIPSKLPRHPHYIPIHPPSSANAPQQLTPPSTTDYPLPPSEDKTEILRVVVRESMSMDLLSRLIGDVIEVTEHVMAAAPGTLSVFQPGNSSVEKEHGSTGTKEKGKGAGKRPMGKGVHHTVC